MKKVLKIAGFVFLLSTIGYVIYAYHPEQDKSVYKKKYSYPDSKFITIDGLETHYRIVGNGPDLVLLHGWGGNVHHFDSIVPVLSEHFRVILVDCLGHGLTDPDPNNNYSNENNLLFIEHFFQALHLQKVSIAGNSTGGYWAMLYAKRHPEQVNKLVLLNSRGGTCAKSEETTMTAFNPEDLPFVDKVSPYLLPRVMVKQTLQALFADPSKVSDELVQTTYDLFSIKGKRLLRKHFMSYEHPNDILTGILVPCLLVSGREDHTHTVCQGEELHRKLPNSQLVILENTGHLSMIESPKQTEDAMLKFLL